MRKQKLGGFKIGFMELGKGVVIVIKYILSEWVFVYLAS